MTTRFICPRMVDTWNSDLSPEGSGTLSVLTQTLNSVNVMKSEITMYDNCILSFSGHPSHWESNALIHLPEPGLR